MQTTPVLLRGTSAASDCRHFHSPCPRSCVCSRKNKHIGNLHYYEHMLSLPVAGEDRILLQTNACRRHFETSDDVIHCHVSSCDHVIYSRARNDYELLLLFMILWPVEVLAKAQHFQIMVTCIIILFPCTMQGAFQPLIFSQLTQFQSCTANSSSVLCLYCTDTCS